jgi:hypothetical protein
LGARFHKRTTSGQQIRPIRRTQTIAQFDVGVPDWIERDGWMGWVDVTIGLRSNPGKTLTTNPFRRYKQIHTPSELLTASETNKPLFCNGLFVL